MECKLLQRTICVRVAEIVEGGGKQEFYADLRKSLDTARRAANRAVSLCVGADAELMIGGKLPKLYTYPVISKEFPGAATAAAAIGRAVEAKYKQERWHVGAGRKSVCNYRSFPWPLLCNKSARWLQIEDCGEVLQARIKLLGQWWTVRIAGGAAYRDQVRGLRKAIESGRIGDSKIWVDGKHRAVIGVSVGLPASSQKKQSGKLVVTSNRDNLLVAIKERSPVPFVVSGDQLRGWIAERNRKQQRLRQDRKSGADRKKCIAIQARVSNKWRRRMDTYTHEVSARVVEHARRRKVEELVLDLTVKSFLPSFPWFELATKIQYKCEDAGIGFREITQAVANPDVSKPHVYFKFSPMTGRVKIGKTSVSGGRRHALATDSPDRELVILAIDNQPKAKVSAREKHWHAMFADHRIAGSEWFAGDAVIHWLREAAWLGNAGNRSQIAQVIALEDDPAQTPPSRASVSVPTGNDSGECSQEAVNSAGYSEWTQAAPQATNRSGGC